MISDASLTAVVPYGAGTGPVAVTDPAGSAVLPFTVLPPSITSINAPGSTAPGSWFQIIGQGLQDVTAVTVGGAGAMFSVNCGSLITVTIPPSCGPSRP